MGIKVSAPKSGTGTRNLIHVQEMVVRNGCKYPLTILYLNKIGWFCGSCKNEL